MTSTNSSKLSQLIQDIKKAHQQVLANLRTALFQARDAGELLCKAKKLIDHGLWTKWLYDNFSGSQSNARAYMRIYRRWGDLNVDNDTHMTIEQALHYLRKERPKDCYCPTPVHDPAMEKKRLLEKSIARGLANMPDELVERFFDDFPSLWDKVEKYLIENYAYLIEDPEFKLWEFWPKVELDLSKPVDDSEWNWEKNLPEKNIITTAK